MLSREELRAALPIDPDHLDEACILQPELYAEACDIQAQARAEVAVADLNMKAKQAEIDLSYRSGKLSMGDVKMTEASILSLVTQHPDVIKAKKDLIEAERESAKCSGMITAYDHRRSMITNQVTLYTTNCYHGADIKSRDNESIRKQIQQARKEA